MERAAAWAGCLPDNLVGTQHWWFKFGQFDGLKEGQYFVGLYGLPAPTKPLAKAQHQWGPQIYSSDKFPQISAGRAEVIPPLCSKSSRCSHVWNAQVKERLPSPIPQPPRLRCIKPQFLMPQATVFLTLSPGHVEAVPGYYLPGKDLSDSPLWLIKSFASTKSLSFSLSS